MVIPGDGGAALFDFPMFKSREEVIRYLADYHERHGLQRPHLSQGSFVAPDSSCGGQP